MNAIAGRAHFFHPTIATAGTLVFNAAIDESGSGDAFSTAFQVSASGPVSQNLRASASVITARGTLTTTDVLTVSSTSPDQARTLAAAIPQLSTLSRTKPRHKPAATGTVLFEDGTTVLERVKVRIVQGKAEAKAKLKLTVPGVQTLSAAYVPDPKSKRLGLMRRHRLDRGHRSFRARRSRVHTNRCIER